jgi:hypothetical protein
METMRQVVQVEPDRKIELTLPSSVEPGLVEMLIIMQPVVLPHAATDAVISPETAQAMFGFLPKRTDPMAFQQSMRNEWND